MPRKNARSERLHEFEERLSRIEDSVRRLAEAPSSSLLARPRMSRREACEIPLEPWKHLVRRLHPWRNQLYLTCKNMTARQLVGGIRANNIDEEKASANYGVPVEAIREALAYVQENSRLLEAEAEIERLM